MALADMPVIDKDKCNGCGLCVSVCSCKILVLNGNVVSVVAEKKCSTCTKWCGQCEIVCPTGAITCPFEIVIEEK